MQKRIFSWHGREFIDLSGEARSAASVEEETNSLFRSFEQELKTHGLYLKTAAFESDERSTHHLADARGGLVRIADQILEL